MKQIITDQNKKREKKNTEYYHKISTMIINNSTNRENIQN